MLLTLTEKWMQKNKLDLRIDYFSGLVLKNYLTKKLFVMLGRAQGKII